MRVRLARLAVALGFAGLLLWVARERQHAQERERYGGHTVREWVDRALAEHPMSLDGESARMIERIGPPAVPHLMARLHRLQDSPLRERLLIWQNEWLPASLHRLNELPNADARVFDIVRLLSALGPEARPAVPAIIGAAGQVHFGVYREILNCLADMGPAAVEAIPWLRGMADEGGEGDFHAAWALWRVATNDPTFQRMVVQAIQVKRKPSLADDELSLVRDDSALNRVIVPLLAEVLGDSRVDEEERKSAAGHLGERGLDAVSAFPWMRKAAAQTDSPGLRDEINAAIGEILDLMEAEPAGATTLPTTSLTNGQNVVSVNPSSPADFFRLRHP